MSKKEIMIIDEQPLKDKIYIIRDQQVMLDSNIADYFKVETKALNRAMKRNINRFPESFCFQLTYEESSRCQIGTLKSGKGSNIKYLPYAYTEQGIAMLTSCLHTDRAIAASIQIMEAFVEMRHYLEENRQLLPYKELYILSNRQDTTETDIRNIKDIMVTKNDLSDLMKLFSNDIKQEEILILNGQPFKADLAYHNIYKQATNNIVIIDDYISIKTLRHLTTVKDNISITIISDNKARNHLCLSEYNDFLIEYPNKKIIFIRSDNLIHDRYIILDNNTSKMKVFLSGSSLKDSGNKITTITQIKDINEFRQLINVLLLNRSLILK